jgi:hypothetical protein
MKLEKICALVELMREDVLKGAQYACIFITWFQ